MVLRKAFVAEEIAVTVVALDVGQALHAVGAVDGQPFVGGGEQCQTLLQNHPFDVVEGLSEHSDLELVVEHAFEAFSDVFVQACVVLVKPFF